MTDDPYLLMYLISRVLCYFIASNSSHKDLYFACLSDIIIVLSCYRIYIIDFITDLKLKVLNDLEQNTANYY